MSHSVLTIYNLAYVAKNADRYCEFRAGCYYPSGIKIMYHSPASWGVSVEGECRKGRPVAKMRGCAMRERLIFGALALVPFRQIPPLAPRLGFASVIVRLLLRMHYASVVTRCWFCAGDTVFLNKLCLLSSKSLVC